ncbi:hypothetical protein PMI18_01255, partial [Pseudomonas sp. GM102]
MKKAPLKAPFLWPMQFLVAREL